MSPVFRHGRLRLYLLKLLDEAPRHGYEVIRLLQDRFLGVYAPSPGTIYPRLARLEEEGLVTHDEVDGKKVYRITDKGREEIRARLDDLAELEEEITDSVRDIAREVTQDVRDTVRNLREELTWAARDVRREGREQARDAAAHSPQQEEETPAGGPAQARDTAGSARDAAAQARDTAGAARDAAAQARDTAGTARDAAAQARDTAGSARGRPGGQQRGGPPRERPDWAAFQDWQSWAGWRERPGKHGWPGFGGFPGSAAPGSAAPGSAAPGSAAPGSDARGSEAPGPKVAGPWPRPKRGGAAKPDAGLFRDLERLAVEFARELRSAAFHTESVGENALGDLRAILEETLTKVRDEVFGGAAAGSAGTTAETRPADGAETPGADPAGAADTGPAGDGGDDPKA